MTRRSSDVGLGLGVRYAVQVLNRDGSLAHSIPAKSNLILDSGLDLVASQLLADLFTRAAVGTGTTPVKRDSGLTTFTRAGNVVSASANFFEAGDVGRLLKFDSGEEMYVTAYTDPQTVTVGVSGALGASQGTVWYVNQTGLTAETKRTNTYGSDSGDNQTSYVGGTYTMKRTFIFSAEAAPITYNELGWSYTSSAGNNLFGRDIISGGVSLSTGQQLKVVVELSVALGPSGPVAYTNVVTGWTQNGNCGVESVPTGNPAVISYVDGGGATQSGQFGNPVLEPSQTVNKVATLSSMTTAISAITQSDLALTGSIATKALTAAGYVSGSRTRTFSGTFLVGEGNSASIRSLILNRSGFTTRAFRVLLDAAETKDSNHTLTLSFRLTWSRTLVN